MLTSYAQKPTENLPKLSQHCFYMLCRSTQQKVGFIAERFNLMDSKSTHVGIGILENGKLMVYHVTNDTGNQTALLHESFERFCAAQGVVYWSLWECPINERQLSRLKKQLRSFQMQKVIFDMDFEPDNQKLYCSEFCAELLRKLAPTHFNFQLHRKKLDFFYRTALGRTVLRYYPVDFFQQHRAFKKIYETAN